MPIINNPYHPDKLNRLNIKKFEKEGLKNYYISKNEFKIQLNKIDNFLKNFKNKNINHIDLTNIFCEDEKCYSVKDKKILISDDDHPSIFAAQLINNMIIKEINSFYEAPK